MYPLDDDQQRQVERVADFLLGDDRIGCRGRGDGSNPRRSPGRPAGPISPSTAATNKEADVPKLRDGCAARAGGPRRPRAPRHRARRQAQRDRLRLRLPLHRPLVLPVLRRLRGVRADRHREGEPRRPGDVRRRLRRRPEPPPRRTIELAEPYGQQLADWPSARPRRPARPITAPPMRPPTRRSAPVREPAYP